MFKKRPPTWCWLLLLCLVAIAHASAIRFGFVDWDDNRYIAQQERIHQVSWQNLAKIFNPAHTADDPFPEFQPVRDLSLLVDYQIGHGDALIFHTSNLLWHLFNILLVYLFMQLLTGRAGLAFAVAALFALHPTHVESVAWVSSRKDLLGLAFTLLTLISFLYGWLQDKRHYMLLALLFYLLALFSKSQAVTAPLLLLLILPFIHQWCQQPLSWRRLSFALSPFLILTGGYLALFLGLQFAQTSPSTYYSMGFDPNPVAIIKTFALYVKLALWPLGHVPYYDNALSLRKMDLNFYIALATLLTFFVFMIRGCLQRRVWGLGMLLFLIQLLPVLNFLPHPVWVADRYLYFATPFLYLALLAFWPQNVPLWNRRAVVAGSVLLLLLSWFSLIQTQVWKNSQTLAQAILKTYPQSITAKMMLARALTQEEQTAQAIALYRQILEQPQVHESQLYLQNSARLNLASLLMFTRDYSQAESLLQDYLSQRPDDSAGYYQLGKIALRQQEYARALPLYETAIRLAPDTAHYYYDLGVLYVQWAKVLPAKQPQFWRLAEAAWMRAIELVPNYRDALNNLALLQKHPQAQQ